MCHLWASPSLESFLQTSQDYLDMCDDQSETTFITNSQSETSIGDTSDLVLNDHYIPDLRPLLYQEDQYLEPLAGPIIYKLHNQEETSRTDQRHPQRQIQQGPSLSSFGYGAIQNVDT